VRSQLQRELQLSKPHSGTLHCLLMILHHTIYIKLDPHMPHYLHNMCYDSRSFAEQEQTSSLCRETANITQSYNSLKNQQTTCYIKNAKLSANWNRRIVLVIVPKGAHVSSVWYKLYMTTPVSNVITVKLLHAYFLVSKRNSLQLCGFPKSLEPWDQHDQGIFFFF